MLSWRKRVDRDNFSRKALFGFGSPFSTVFIFAALLLIILPFVSSVSDILTRSVERSGAFFFLDKYVVPYEARMFAGVLARFPVSVEATPEGIWLNGTFIKVLWNCVGWQAAIFLVATFLSGFRGNFTKTSLIEAVIIGVLGTYLVNLLRFLIVGAFSIFFGRGATLIFHDWFSLIFVLIWFFFFWWFCYSFVLETKDAN